MGISKGPNRKLQQFLKRLGPDFECFARRGVHLIHRPVGFLLGGFWFDPTVGNPDRRWISTFISPLYLPSETVWYEWGNRIPRPGPENQVQHSLYIQGAEEDLEETVRTMKSEGLETVLPALNLEGFYEYLTSWRYQGTVLKSACYEAMAYTALLIDRTKDVEEHMLDCEMSLTLRPDGSPLHFWEEHSLDRIRKVRGVLTEHGTSAAVDLLLEWRNASVKQFGIEDIALRMDRLS